MASEKPTPESPLAPDISVAVVSYNTCGLLRACLQSLQAREAEGEAALEIIVADNGSTDGSGAMVQTEFPTVRLMDTGGNIGFGRANNAALQDARGRYFCLINSDAEVLPGALSHALAYLDAHPDVGLVGGQLLWPDGRPQVSWSQDPTLAEFLAQQTFLSPLLRFLPSPRRREGAAFDVPQINGAFMMIRRDAWQQVGGFDPAYFMYTEDVDLNVRLRRAGWRVVFLPDVHITHHLGGSSRADWEKRATMVAAYNQSRYYYFTRFGKKAGHRVRTYALLGAALRLTGWSLLAPFRPGARDKVKLFCEVWRRTRGMI